MRNAWVLEEEEVEEASIDYVKKLSHIFVFI
jgi:hypothetical protein